MGFSDLVEDQQKWSDRYRVAVDGKRISPRSSGVRRLLAWRTKDGRDILLCDMSDNHLMNAIRYVLRQPLNGLSEKFCSVVDLFSASEDEGVSHLAEYLNGGGQFKEGLGHLRKMVEEAADRDLIEGYAGVTTPESFSPSFFRSTYGFLCRLFGVDRGIK